MRRRLPWMAAAGLLAAVTAAPVAADGPNEMASASVAGADRSARRSAALSLSAAPEARVDLSEHVPARWLDGRTDALPLTPERWRRRVPRECRTRGGYRDHCQGARIVPAPHGPAAALAERLALGQRATAMLLMHDRPLPEWLDAVREADPNERLLFPVQGGRLGRGFGHTRSGSLSHRMHRGVDIGGVDEGAPIRAARGGLVAYADNELTGYGNVVILLHHEGFSTFYAHCRALRVFAGQRVERGDVIAEVGMTGFAPAPHLHFEWRQRGWPRDPARHFQR